MRRPASRLLLGFMVAAGVLLGGAQRPQSSLAYPRSAVYISLGDGIQWGFGAGDRGHSVDALFARYLSGRLHRDVEWVSLAKTSVVTTDTFLRGPDEQMGPLASALATYRRQDRPVVAITLSVGGNNLVAMGNACSSPPCTELYQRALAAMTPQLDEIYQGIDALKDPATPLLVLTYYNASDCGQPGTEYSPTELGVRGWNTAIGAAVARAGAFVVDGYTPFRGQACQLVHGLDLSEQGHALMEKQYEAAYAALPSTHIDPFVKSETSPVVAWAFLAGACSMLVLLVTAERRIRKT